jgi:hypothetical protein
LPCNEIQASVWEIWPKNFNFPDQRYAKLNQSWAIDTIKFRKSQIDDVYDKIVQENSFKVGKRSADETQGMCDLKRQKSLKMELLSNVRSKLLL